MNKPLVIALISLAGCTDDAGEDVVPTFPDDRPDVGVPAPEVPPAEAVPVATDFCDDSAHTTASWHQYTTTHFTLSYLPDTPAARDRMKIASRLESAYAMIRGQLGVAAEPMFTVNLSPNRVAAVAHNKSFGRGWPNLGRYDVIYTGEYDSYEVQRYGQLLTLMLNYHVDPQNRERVSFLTTGVAEYLDQSGRDLHESYAMQLEAGLESRVRPAELDSKDVQGRNVGRAGSFVQFLIDRYGMETFADIFRASAVNWSGGCYAHVTAGCVSTPEQLTTMLDVVLSEHTGEGWATVQPLWQAHVEQAMNREVHGMGPNTTAEIENVLRLMDEAIDTKNAAMYRSTMEGWYCDWGGDEMRAQIASRAVSAFGTSTSKVLALYDTGIKNFSTAQALVQRTDEHGVATFDWLMFERFPVGWRVTYGPDWY